MLLLALTLTFLGGLTIARRLADPPCPSCSAKSWTEQNTRLECSECGWSNLATVPTNGAEGVLAAGD